MNRFRLTFLCLGLGFAGFAVRAEISPPPMPTAAPAGTASLMPPQIPPSSPVTVFRRLLSMSVTDQESYLTNRPSEVRAALRAKIREYRAMDPDARELRLRATELRWQLLPLLRLTAAERASRLALVPEDLAPLVKSRLAEWDQLPADLQAEFLANNSTLHYFAHVDTTNQPAADSAAEEQRQKMAGQLSQFFELTPDEKQRTLKTLSVTERAQMESTLSAFAKLTVQQRIECRRAFTKFAELSPAERTEFLKNAERWAQMSPKERQTWRDLVARVPAWPPLPPNFAQPPLPPPMPPSSKLHPAMATN